ncbi:MAG: hypothetical protein WCD18_07805 [Thermosynechococcaceae cyanobacterium]
MISSSLTPEQDAKLAEALDVAKRLEQQSKEMSERATAIAEKYYKHRYEAAIAAQQKLGSS